MYSMYWIVLLVALVDARSTYIKVPKEFIDDAIKGSVQCAEEFGLPVDTFNRLLSNNFEDSPAMRKYIYCLGIALEVGDENGNLKYSLTKYASNDKRKAEIIKVIDECNKQVSSDKYEMAYKVSTCYLNTSPVQFKV